MTQNMVGQDLFKCASFWPRFYTLLKSKDDAARLFWGGNTEHEQVRINSNVFHFFLDGVILYKIRQKLARVNYNRSLGKWS